ncbi:MAG: hypothetical protein KAW12_17405 [Candidatus Aminicenantes bacterium]|nr:hypothetical protein [Candidatus Aminicenantes bacterium]
MKLNCPQCGDENQIAVPEAFLTCRSCSSSLYIDIDKIAVVRTYAPTVKPENLSLYLKKDFHKVGFDEEIKITHTIPIYLPFHQIKGQNRLSRASSHFPIENIPMPSTQKIIFNPVSAEEKRIEIFDIDTQPPGSEEETLYYLPFFQIKINFRGKAYDFFVNAVNGEVFGTPIPYTSTKETVKLFPLFLLTFILLILANIMFWTVAVVSALVLVILASSYYLSVRWIGKKLYKIKK